MKNLGKTLAALLVAMTSLLAVPAATATVPLASICEKASLDLDGPGIYTPPYERIADDSAAITSTDPGADAFDRTINAKKCRGLDSNDPLSGKPTEGMTVRVLHFEANVDGATIQVYEATQGVLVFEGPIPTVSAPPVGILLGTSEDPVERTYIVEVMGHPTNDPATAISYKVWFSEA